MQSLNPFKRGSAPKVEPMPRVVAEKIGYLSQVDIFKDLSKDEMEWLERVTLMITTEKGKIIYTPGETVEVLFLLKKGRVQIYRLSLEGKKLVIAVLGPGTFFGEMSLVGQGMYDAFAEAVEDSTICAMSRSDVEGLLTTKPTVALRLLQVIGQRLNDAERALEELAFKNVAARLSSLLLRLADDQEEPIVSGLTHQDLADMTGTFRETATQTLNELKAAGLIDIGRMKITILDLEGLRQVAQL